MNLFNASTLGMLFTEVSFNSLSGGDTQKVGQIQSEIAQRQGSMIAALGGIDPALQQAIADSFGDHVPEALRFLVNAGLFAANHNQKPKQIWEFLAQFGSNAVHVGNAGQIASGTASAFITMCHVVASYDNAIKLADANAKLDELLKVHSREYRTKLESIYNRLGDLFLESARGLDRTGELSNCSQDLDHLTLIWLDEIKEQLEPVSVDTDWVGFLAGTKSKWALPLLLVAPLYLPATSVSGHIVYRKWVSNISAQLDKIVTSIRLLSISIWLRHVISHHTCSNQPLYRLYGDRLERISTKACSIKDAVVRSQKLLSVDPSIIKHLEWVENLPQRVQATLTESWNVPQLESSYNSGVNYRVAFDQDNRSYQVERV